MTVHHIDVATGRYMVDVTHRTRAMGMMVTVMAVPLAGVCVAMMVMTTIMSPVGVHRMPRPHRMVAVMPFAISVTLAPSMFPMALALPLPGLGMLAIAFHLRAMIATLVIGAGQSRTEDQRHGQQQGGNQVLAVFHDDPPSEVLWVSGPILTTGTESILNRPAVLSSPPMNPSRRDAACPLCGHADSRPYHQDRRRVYRQCPRCALVFVPSAFHLAPEAEKAEYDRHENALDDPGYRRFLSRMAEPMLARLPPAASGLDFGCGPAPLLAELFRQAGHRMALYDLYYANNPDALTGRYDFITCTETLEHLARPAGTFARWLDLLAPGGLLGIMTKRVQDHAAFTRWHYIHDPTHIAFYAEASFMFLAREHGLALEVIGPDVVILQKNPHRSGA